MNNNDKAIFEPLIKDNAITIKPSGYGTYSGTDMIVNILLPSSPPYAVGECSTVTYSVLRDVQEVRTLGRISVRGYARGQRRVAGTIIFTVFEQHTVNNLCMQVDYLRKIMGLKGDELPPFDIVITGGSEHGRVARLVIYGAVAFEEGKVISIEDMFTENVWSYMARDIELLKFNDYMVAPLPPLKGGSEFNQNGELMGKFNVSDLSVKR